METLIPKRMANRKTIVFKVMNIDIKDLMILAFGGLVCYFIYFNTLLLLPLKLGVIAIILIYTTVMVIPIGAWTKPWKLLYFKYKWLGTHKNYQRLKITRRSVKNGK